MNQDKSFIITFPITMVTSIVITIVLIIAFDKNIGFSFLMGAMVSMMTMSMLYKSSKGLMELPKEIAQKRAMRNYVIRYAFYALILVIAGLSENLSVLLVGLGLFTFKFVLLGVVFMEKRRGEENV